MIVWNRVPGPVRAYVYKEGRNGMEVRPDFGDERWYWSVHWPKQTGPPKKQADGSFNVPVSNARTIWGHAPTEEEAKQAAEKCFHRGRHQKNDEPA